MDLCLPCLNLLDIVRLCRELRERAEIAKKETTDLLKTAGNHRVCFMRMLEKLEHAILPGPTWTETNFIPALDMPGAKGDCPAPTSFSPNTTTTVKGPSTTSIRADATDVPGPSLISGLTYEQRKDMLCDALSMHILWYHT
jgi:hypothetical protein